MLKKIVSDGKPGAAQAAIDVAGKLEIPCGGWIPKGRKAGNGKTPNPYASEQFKPANPPSCAELNVVNSDGSLLLTHGLMTGETDLVRTMAIKHSRPWIHIDLKRSIRFKAARKISQWIVDHRIEVLNVNGSSAAEDPAIYQATRDLLETTFYLGLVEINLPDPFSVPNMKNAVMGRVPPPQTVDQAVDWLLSELPALEKTRIASISQEALPDAIPILSPQIITEFGLDSGNGELMESCRTLSESDEIDAAEASRIIIGELWEKLQASSGLRRIK